MGRLIRLRNFQKLHISRNRVPHPKFRYFVRSGLFYLKSHMNYQIKCIQFNVCVLIFNYRESKYSKFAHFHKFSLLLIIIFVRWKLFYKKYTENVPYFSSSQFSDPHHQTVYLWKSITYILLHNKILFQRVG